MAKVRHLQASGLTASIPFTCASAIWGNPVSLFAFAAGISPASQQSPWGWQHPLDHRFGSPLHLWRLEITDGCDFFVVVY